MKIAIVRLSAIGDIVHTMVVLQFIKAKFPNAIIDWIVEESLAGVLENNPHINAIHKINLKSIKKSFTNIFTELKKIKEISKNNYDLVIDAQGLIKSAIVAKVVGGHIVGSKIVGFDKDSIREGLASFFYDEKISISYTQNKIFRNCYLCSKALGFSISNDDILAKKPFLYSSDYSFDFLSTTRKNIVFVVGSSWDSKNYPWQKYINIIKELNENPIIVWGSESEKEIAYKIKDKVDDVIIAPKLSFDELKCLISKVELVIGNDTGPTHMAWGLNIPSIMLFGPTPIEQAYQTQINFVLKSPSIVNHYKLDKNDYSIEEIKEIEVVKIARKLLK
ncbi:lipopolysaccharide heptosyltransferase I [Arcobacter sp. FWKO B]|uniref:lipopolysaccharide heptosyltransferase I n=1 Tax=Arcobacter sp. FWKO B TaxID=2593672 RepID=UPI0018A36441|nr:lipopolysaccharide heptosyltransferase I [Arcobacter sp. FWKO B]QOG11513.1 lipopolysaccharide heptosyltransferase I [Arcobacter sp. FWKO B]